MDTSDKKEIMELKELILQLKKDITDIKKHLKIDVSELVKTDSTYLVFTADYELRISQIKYYNEINLKQYLIQIFNEIGEYAFTENPDKASIICSEEYTKEYIETTDVDKSIKNVIKLLKYFGIKHLIISICRIDGEFYIYNKQTFDNYYDEISYISQHKNINSIKSKIARETSILQELIHFRKPDVEAFDKDDIKVISKFDYIKEVPKYDQKEYYELEIMSDDYNYEELIHNFFEIGQITFNKRVRHTVCIASLVQIIGKCHVYCNYGLC